MARYTPEFLAAAQHGYEYTRSQAGSLTQLGLENNDRQSGFS